VVIRIKNLHASTIIGVNDWERDAKQDVMVNVQLAFDGASAGRSDDLADTVDYKALTQRLLSECEKSRFRLIERLATHLLEVVMATPKVLAARVEVDKPRALRFADSVSVEVSGGDWEAV
jgi:FolB domain-containing protein